MPQSAKVEARLAEYDRDAAGVRASAANACREPLGRFTGLFC